MRRNIFSIILLLLCTHIAMAMPMEQRITLKNGNVYEGYVYKSYVNGKIYFNAEKSIVNISDISKINITVNSRSLDELNDKWAEWAEENPMYVTVSNGKRSINFSNIVGNETVYNVFILERGEKSLKYLSFNDEAVILDNSQISAIETFPRSYLDLSGVNVEVQIKDSISVKGEIVCKTDKAVKILTLNRSVEVIPFEKISKISKYRVNENLSIVQQVPRLDFIVLKNATSVTGLIILETFNKNKEQEYLLVETKNGEHVHVKKADIDYVEKIENSDFVNIKDVEINDGDMMICGNLCDTIHLEVNGDFFIINDTIVPMVIDCSGADKIVDVIMKQNDSVDNLKLLKVERRRIEKSKLWKTEVLDANMFTYRDIVEKSVKENGTFMSVNGNVHKSYKLEAGSYVIFNTQDKKCYYIMLKQTE